MKNDNCHQKCKVQDRGEWRDGYFYGVFQYAEPYAGLLVGTAPGQIAYPVAVVEVRGHLVRTEVGNVRFEGERK